MMTAVTILGHIINYSTVYTYMFFCVDESYFHVQIRLPFRNIVTYMSWIYALQILPCCSCFLLLLLLQEKKKKKHFRMQGCIEYNKWKFGMLMLVVYVMFGVDVVVRF